MAEAVAVKADDTQQWDQFGELGKTGVRRWAGIIDEEFLADLKDDRGRRTYREMSENDAVIGAALTVMDQYMRQVPVRVETAGQDASSQQALELVESALDDFTGTWEDTLGEIGTNRVYGWSALETVYKQRQGPSDDPTQDSQFSDGRIGWRKFAPRSQLSLDRWEFDDAGDLCGLTQRPAPDYVPVTIPADKLLLFRARVQADNPEGVSLLRRAYRSWYYKNKLQFIEAVGIDRDATGIPLIYAPQELFTAASGSAQAQVLAQLKEIATRVRQDEQHGIVMPQQYDSHGKPAFEFTLVASPGSRSLDAGAVIERYDQRIAMALLADFVLLGHEAVGSFALADSKTSVFALAVAGWMDSILSVWNRTAIPRLLKLNGMTPEHPVELKRGDIETPDLPAIGQYITALAGAGMPLFPDPDLESYLREAAHLPAPIEDDGDLPPMRPAPMPEDDDTGEPDDEPEDAQKLLQRLASGDTRLRWSAADGEWERVPPSMEKQAEPTCPTCAASFTRSRATQVYCTKRCKHTAQVRRYRARKRRQS